MPGAVAPTPQPDPAPRVDVADYTRKLVLCVTYIIVSTVLIRFNKLMMQPNRFPHAMALSSIHTFITTVCCGCIYLVAPSMMPAMEATKGNRLPLLKWFLPIGVLFAVALYCSNEAYVFCNVTFLQFMKEANVIIIFSLSCIVGLQQCTRIRVFTILWIITGASVSVYGEVRFVWLGFAFQMVSQFAECTRNVMGEFILSGRKFDALTYNMFLAPICCLILVVATCVHPEPRLHSDFMNNWHLLAVNGFIAFSLNILVAAVIKECSAVGFVLCGLTKDIVIVVVSSLAFQEPVTYQQTAAFMVTLMGIFFWSLLKSHPESLPVRLAESALCLKGHPDESKALLANLPHTTGEKSV